MPSFTVSGQRFDNRYQLTTPFVPASEYEEVDVWNAVDTYLGTAVRVIALLPDSPATVEALDAARRSALVGNANIVRILSVGDSYIVTEIPLGTMLSRYLTGESFPPAQAHALVGEVASSLNAARSRGVRHLQLSPSHVRVGGMGEIYVDGLGVDAALSGIHTDSLLGVDADRLEARGLSVLLARLLTGNAEANAADVLDEAGSNDAIPEQLRSLCIRESEGDGPLSPSDVVRELAPWGQVSPETFPAPVAVASVSEAVAFDADAALVASSVDPLDDVVAKPSGITPQWASLSDFAAETVPAAEATASDEATESPGDDEIAGGTTPAPLKPAPLEPVASPVTAQIPAVSHETEAPASLLSLKERREEKRAERAASRPVPTLPEEELAGEIVEEKRYNPSKIVVTGAIVSLVVLLVWAVTTLFSPTSVPEGSASSLPSQSAPAHTTEPEESESPVDDTSGLPTPVIKGVTILNPYAAGVTYGTAEEQDNPKMLSALLDGKRSTTWKTWPYNDPTYSKLKAGVGLTLSLQGKSKVTSVTLASPLQGGKVQLLSASPDTPGFTVLAEAPMSETMTLTPKHPYAAENVILWFPELAKADGAHFRAEIADIGIQ